MNSSAKKNIDWRAVADLGKVHDHVIASRLRCNHTAVCAARRRLGVPAFTESDAAYLDRKTTQAGECIVWTGTRNEDGYGIAHAGRKIFAHRLAWDLAHGPIPDGQCVLHRCDNPPCCSPAHLFLGTRKDNAVDRDTKGRRVAARGSAHPQAKLTEANVIEIRTSTAPARVFAERFGVSVDAVQVARRGRNWRHVKVGAA